LRILAPFPFELKVQSPPEDWVGRLSITTPAPSHKLRTKKCATKTENSLPVIDPFSVIIPTTFFQIIAPTTVILAPKNGFKF
jgi:hypothetical protein